MAEEIQEAVQIIRVAYDGIEIAMKVGSGGIAAMQKAIDFLKGMLDYEKSLGKTSMRKLLLKGGDLQVLQFNTEDEINAILSGITDSRQKTVCSYALHRVGYPYSQDLRDSGNYYDCSSLAYYSWKDAGVDISHGGATTAAAEAQGLDEAGKTVTYDQLQPGDLIFYSFTSNGRYMNISHVAVYVGNGKVVEALNESLGVVYRDVASTGKIVVIGRP